LVKLFRTAVIFLLLFCSVTLAYGAGVYQDGDQGEEVAAIQTQLNAVGYNVGNADGDFGAMTVKAVKAFQRDHGLEVDGIIGAQTYQAIMGRAIPVSRDASNIGVRRVVQTSLRYQGVPYVFGGTTPNGFDCSGFTRYVFAQVGINLPRAADEQYEIGRSVAYNNLQPGDMVYFSTYASGASHVGIYLGNAQFISATSSRGITIDRLDSGYWGARYMGARRVL
jgi:hypothetical protein